MIWPVVLLLCTWKAICIKDELILQQWGGNRHWKEIQHVIIHVKTPFLLEATLEHARIWSSETCKLTRFLTEANRVTCTRYQDQHCGCCTRLHIRKQKASPCSCQLRTAWTGKVSCTLKHSGQPLFCFIQPSSRTILLLWVLLFLSKIVTDITA